MNRIRKFMRPYWLIGGFAVLAIGVIFSFYFSGDSESVDNNNATENMREQSRPTGDVVRIHGLSLLKKNNPDMTLLGNATTVNFDPEKKVWYLRGQTLVSERRVPFFGTFKQICKAYENKYCWQLTELVVDDRTRRLVGGRAAGTAGLERNETEKVKEDRELTSDSGHLSHGPLQSVDKKSLDDLVKKGLDTTIEKRDAESPKPAETPGTKKPFVDGRLVWRVTEPQVNARLGPGTEFEVAFTISPEVPLYLVRKKGAWGLFEYLGNKDTVGQVWLYLDLVAKK